ncbi:hypothetical protein [Yersinia enterocolitica]|uniref:hypothetical protein n=1 Tax=Yersinia enterocolitica TaxID=630 RepID=UPI0005E9EB9B|nr:hypothetical protein [Yersinia enterocolitica]CQJ65735.1 Uncharacterised protein [Yersinia enterocolitica]
MNNIEELNIEYLKINARLVANGVAAISSKWAGETILALIAQLEAAQKERDEFRLAFQQSEQAKQELFAQKDLLITANLNISRRAEKAEAELSAANEKPIQITLGAGDVMISHIKWPDAQGISFAPMPTGYTGIGLNVDEQVSGKNSGEIGANVIIKSSSIESLKVLRDIVLIAIAGFTVEGDEDAKETHG